MGDRVVELLRSKYLKSPIRYEGMQRQEPLEIPEDALREILYNSIIHKQYSGAPIQMRVYDGHIEIWNEGNLPDGYTVDMLWQKHHSKPRNMNIATIFNKAGFIEAWGRGFKIIREGFETEGMERPVLEVTCGGVQVTIKRPDIVGNNVGNDVGNVSVMQLTERQRKIYHLIASGTGVTAKQMSVMLNVVTRTIERELSSMQERGIIRHEGKARTGHWVVLIKL